MPIPARDKIPINVAGATALAVAWFVYSAPAPEPAKMPEPKPVPSIVAPQPIVAEKKRQVPVPAPKPMSFCDKVRHAVATKSKEDLEQMASRASEAQRRRAMACMEKR